MADRQIAIVGECWGQDEALLRIPFVGPAGQELNKMLSEAGINRNDCHLTCVFNFQPDRNDPTTLCVRKDDPDRVRGWPPLAKGGYLHRKHFGEVTRLLGELADRRPNLVIALGNTASWALLQQTAISKIRGTVAYSTTVDGLKCLPTYDPVAVLRQWELRHVTVLDLAKAKREAEFPEIRRPIRRIWTDPSLEDCYQFYRQYLENAERISFDIETNGDQITCIGFAPAIDIALVVPFWDLRHPGANYWPSLEEELAAWRFVAKVLGHPAPKVAQNGLYDIQFLWMKYGIAVANFKDDTMLLHHSLQPESPKALGFLGSVYCNESSWKELRNRGKHTIKHEE